MRLGRANHGIQRIAGAILEYLGIEPLAKLPGGRPRQIRDGLPREAEREVEPAHPRPGTLEKSLERREVRQLLYLGNKQAIVLGIANRDRDRLSCTRCRGEVDAVDSQALNEAVAALTSSCAEMLWMLPKPATKRASRGAMRQKEKSASSKLIACSGKRSSQALFRF